MNAGLEWLNVCLPSVWTCFMNIIAIETANHKMKRCMDTVKECSYVKALKQRFETVHAE
jgi:hypothetical protein